MCNCSALSLDDHLSVTDQNEFPDLLAFARDLGSWLKGPPTADLCASCSRDNSAKAPWLRRCNSFTPALFVPEQANPRKAMQRRGRISNKFGGKDQQGIDAATR